MLLLIRRLKATCILVGHFWLVRAGRNAKSLLTDRPPPPRNRRRRGRAFFGTTKKHIFLSNMIRWFPHQSVGSAPTTAGSEGEDAWPPPVLFETSAGSFRDRQEQSSHEVHEGLNLCQSALESVSLATQTPSPNLLPHAKTLGPSHTERRAVTFS